LSTVIPLGCRERKVIRVLTRHEEIMLVCGNCGADVAAGVRFCQNCGAVVQVTAPKVAVLPFKIERTAILLAALPGVLIMGVGHFYLARIARGLIILGASIVTGMVFFVAVFGGFFSSSLLVAALVGSVRLALWIWQIVDARKLTKKYNESLEGTGKPPW
jgi:TM2 domain-containing membrane protein YozV